jgi:hypothetical protein
VGGGHVWSTPSGAASKGRRTRGAGEHFAPHPNFTITVISTLVFADITPKTDPACPVVSAQMLLELVLIGAVVRLLFNAARSRISPPTPEAGSASRR